MAIPQRLTDFLASWPTLRVIDRSDPGFEPTKQGFIASPDVPLVIVRPQSEEDAAALIGHLTSTCVRFTIRAGGHDVSCRFVAQDAVQIDLRDISHVRVEEDRTSARIGGGILTQALLDALATEDLMTAFGNAGSVGWCAWAMNGGYGIMSGKYGLGCDQIIGARVILASGQIVEADERLLRALRGAGTAFGAIVELRIKVYPRTKMTYGMIDFGNDVQGSLTTYFENVRSLMSTIKTVPRELYFQPMIMPVAGRAPSFALQFVWSAPPCDEQLWWLERLTELVPGGKPSVRPITPAEHTAEMSKLVDYKNVPCGQSRTVSSRGLVLSPEAAKVVGKHCSLIQREWGAVFIHMLHGKSVVPGQDHPPSVFANRETSLMIEMLGLDYQDRGYKDTAAAWCRDMYEEMANAEGVLDKRYFPLTQRAAYQAETTYGTEELAFLRKVKKELDHCNVFSSISQLSG